MGETWVYTEWHYSFSLQNELLVLFYFAKRARYLNYQQITIYFILHIRSIFYFILALKEVKK